MTWFVVSVETIEPDVIDSVQSTPKVPSAKCRRVGVAGDRIVVGRSNDVLEVGKDIVGGVAAALRPGIGQVHGDAGRRG